MPVMLYSKASTFRLLVDYGRLGGATATDVFTRRVTGRDRLFHGITAVSNATPFVYVYEMSPAGGVQPDRHLLRVLLQHCCPYLRQYRIGFVCATYIRCCHLPMQARLRFRLYSSTPSKHTAVKEHSSPACVVQQYLTRYIGCCRRSTHQPPYEQALHTATDSSMAKLNNACCSCTAAVFMLLL